MSDFLNMSDDDFAKEMPPVVEAASETAARKGLLSSLKLLNQLQ